MASIEYALRISYLHFDTPRKLRAMIGFCKKTGIREVQVVPVDYLHGSVFPPRATIAARRPLLTRILNGLKSSGITASYCVVRTFYGLSVTGKDTIGFKQARVDMSGKASALNPCPLDATYLKYIRFFYADLARTGPAAMLVDDDFRYEYLHMGPTCFCPLHLKEFARRYGHKVTRKSLAAILERPARSRVKNDWMEFKRVLLLEFAKDLRDTVHRINPGIRMGLMLTSTEISALEGRDHRELVETFAGNLRPLVRPGQGCYGDYNRLTLLNGLADTAYQASLMSPDTEIQAEVDFYPHSLFNKSAQFGFDYQIKANLAFNIRKINLWPFGGYHEIGANHPYAAIMARCNRSLNRMVSAIPPRAVPRGITLIYSQKAAQWRPHRQQDVRMYMSTIPPVLWRLGIPCVFAGGDTVILNRDSFPIARDQLIALLETKNIFMDYDALAGLAGMGFSKFLGLRIAGRLKPADYICEWMAPEASNGAVAGRNLRTRGGIGDIVRLAPAGGRWRALTRLVRLDGSRSEPGMLAAEKNGKRMVVCAYRLRATAFWLNEDRQAQLQAIFAWLNGGMLPAVVRGAPDVCPVLLEDAASGTRALSLINASTGCADGFTVELAAAPAARYRVRFVDDDGRMRNMPAADLSRRRDALGVKVTGAAKLHPYQVRCLLVTNADNAK